ncbi:MAG: metal ABC transporter permease [Gemmataceae bacterium]|nr:metal ABC transporter permease [Gemmataceae bacterium]
MFDLPNYTLQVVAAGCSVLGMVSGALGTYAVLRKQSLLGDAISHAALPGVAIGFLLTRSRAPLVLVLGAGIAGWIATLAVMSITRFTRVKSDSALALVLSVFFGFGLMLLTYMQKQLPDARQAGLDRVLFGQAAAMLESDVATMAVLGGVALLLMLVFWKEFKLLSFDPDFGASIGLPMRLLDVLLTTLLVVAIVIGLQTVGVVLMSAMLVAPAAAARQWTDHLGRMVLLAAGIGAASGFAGGVISSSIAHVPTGPVIVLCVSVVVVASLLLAPNRGLLWSWLRHLGNRRRLHLEAVLGDLRLLAAQHDDHAHGHPLAVLRAMSVGRGGLERTLAELRERGLVRQAGPDAWALTPEGWQEAEAQERRRNESHGQHTH